jgi:hypothetical protein
MRSSTAGDLFGEGNVEGFKDLYAIQDPTIAKAMSDAVNEDPG